MTTPRTTPGQLELGAVMRDEGMSLATAAVDASWRVRFDAAIRQLAESGEVFTVDHVRARAGAPEEHWNAIGARMFSASRRKVIERIGYRKSTRDERRAGVVAVWIGTDEVVNAARKDSGDMTGGTQ